MPQGIVLVFALQIHIGAAEQPLSIKLYRAAPQPLKISAAILSGLLLILRASYMLLCNI